MSNKNIYKKNIVNTVKLTLTFFNGPAFYVGIEKIKVFKIFSIIIIIKHNETNEMHT